MTTPPNVREATSMVGEELEKYIRSRCGPNIGLYAYLIFEEFEMKLGGTHPYKVDESIPVEAIRVRGEHSCNNADCRSKNTLTFERQTRSADEPMTVYVRCLDCDQKYVL